MPYYLISLISGYSAPLIDSTEFRAFLYPLIDSTEFQHFLEPLSKFFYLPLARLSIASILQYGITVIKQAVRRLQAKLPR